MKLFGSLTELVTWVFRRSSPSNTITVQPGTTTANAGNVILNLPPVTTGTTTLVDDGSTQTLAGKSIDASTNTLTNITNAAIAAAAAIARSKLASGTADHVVINSGTGAFSSEAQLALTRGGTASNLSATGGTGQYLQQSSVGAVITVGTIPAADVPNLDASKITTGTLATARGGTGVSGTATFPATGTVATDGNTLTLSAKTLASPITTGTNLFAAGAEARFQNAGATFYTGIKASASASADVTYTLPVADGTSGFVLATNGSGATSWVSAAAASVDQGVLTTDLSTGSQTIASGKTLTYPWLTIPLGQTYLINGQLVSAGVVTVSGTLTINGTSNILS